MTAGKFYQSKAKSKSTAERGQYNLNKEFLYSMRHDHQCEHWFFSLFSESQRTLESAIRKTKMQQTKGEICNISTDCSLLRWCKNMTFRTANLNSEKSQT